MKFSESWLREWVNPDLAKEEISESLTMAGFEVEDLKPVAESFTGIVIAKILNIKKHPQADQLQICEVDSGQNDSLTIVCGANNVKVGMKAPLAIIGAVLPNKSIIKETSLRGIVSQGMLCSAMDLGLAEESEGLLELHQDAPLGLELWEYLKLNDAIFDISITPNRGDCLSIKGMAREIAAITKTTGKKINIPQVKPTITHVFPVSIEAKEACPRYVGRVIRGVKADLMSPVWLKERLRRSGIRSISPIVDVTNYVMLELGQPMHAFDLSRLEKKICVRMARKNEELMLLDGSTVKLDQNTLLIADQHKPLAMAGVMGGIDSGINLLTQDVFLESAYFTPLTISRQRQTYQLNSESSYRFERGVDPTLQRIAIERATHLLIDIVGGKPGPIIDVQASKYKSAKTITLRRERITRILGVQIADKAIKDILQSLGFSVKKEKNTWHVGIPSWRFDISQEIDLIEEIARLYGYAKLASTCPSFSLQSHTIAESRIALPRLRRLFSDQGYHEVVTYSFVDYQLQKLLDPENQPKKLMNPITADMTVMRTNLWPGLIRTYLYNRDRQQTRMRLFETGLCFTEDFTGTEPVLLQTPTLGGLASGQPFSEQWGIASRDIDFYDVKGDIENILQLTHIPDEFYFKPAIHPALHPGQTAIIQRQNENSGILGRLHPAIQQQLEITEPIFLFEFNLDALLTAKPPYYNEISKFPEIRRDIAILVKRDIPIEEIQDTIVRNGGEWLRRVTLFDVYLGEGVPKDKKSVAFALILQHADRTLRDEEVAENVQRIVGKLRQTLGAEVRG